MRKHPLAFIDPLLKGAEKLFFIFIACLFLYGFARTIFLDNHGIETAEAKTVLIFEDPDAHITIEYFVDGTRYTREVLKTTVDLVSGTARDFGIHPNHLLALCLQEGYEITDGVQYSCSPTAIGDNGWAFGAFQINRSPSANPNVPVEDAKHLYFSARWTAERMLRYNYRNNPKFAMQAHNGIHSKGYGNTVWQIAKTLHPII